MKVVINVCFGGFSLSDAGVMRYAKLKGINVYSWVDNITLNAYGDAQTARERGFFVHYATVPVKDGSENAPEGTYFSDRDILRNDPALVQTVEEMGKDADGACAKLKVIEIPDGTDYTIEEYDGLEHIAEVHNTWR